MKPSASVPGDGPGLLRDGVAAAQAGPSEDRYPHLGEQKREGKIQPSRGLHRLSVAALPGSGVAS